MGEWVNSTHSSAVVGRVTTPSPIAGGERVGWEVPGGPRAPLPPVLFPALPLPLLSFPELQDKTCQAPGPPELPLPLGGPQPGAGCQSVTPRPLPPASLH